MILDKLYEFLSIKDFQNPDTGNLFFPAYIYTYDPKLEYQVRREIIGLIEKLKRPNNFLDCLILNIYEEFIQYLKDNSFNGENNLLQDIFEFEQNNPDAAYEEIHGEIQKNFFKYLKDKTQSFFSKVNDESRVYLIVYGMGSIFPYLRTSELLKKTEEVIKNFKIIVFYPGSVFEKGFSLFNQLSRDNQNEKIYRVNHLNKAVHDE